MFGQFVDNLVDKAVKSGVMNEGDYIGDDGLIYCGKCKTRKQTEIKIFGEVRRPPCLCKCQAEQRDREEEARKRAEDEKRIKLKRRECFTQDEQMRNWTFANDDRANERVTNAMQRYVDNFPNFKKQGKGLLLYGNCGTGKTYAACEVANALIDKGYTVRVTNFAHILNTLQGTFEKQEYIDNLCECALLVIDDLGIERSTSFAKEQVYNIVDSRYRLGLPMIITTNLTMDKIKATDDIDNMRIYDRILERCFPVEVSGENRRRKAIRDSYGDTKNLLGL